MNWHGFNVCIRSFKTEAEPRNNFNLHDITVGHSPKYQKYPKPNIKWLTRFPKDMLCPECG